MFFYKRCMLSKNSPGLWPMACQILDMSQSIHRPINQSTHQSIHQPINSSTHQPINRSINRSIGSRIRGHILFLEYRARITGAAEGPARDQLLGSLVGGRHTNFVLKSLRFLIQFFSNVWSIWGARMLPKSTKIQKKNALQNCTWFSYRFRYHFSSNFLGFSLPADTENQAKTMECCHFLYFFWFSSRLPCGIDFGWFWHRFGEAFGINFPTFSGKKRVQKIIKISCWVFLHFL